MDVNEEFTALHGRSLIDQAEYLNDVINFLIEHYYPAKQRQRPHLPLPKSVILIGHSMGGFVARTLFTLHNHRFGSVNVIITLTSPHLRPPLPIDPLISKTYASVNKFWRHHTSVDGNDNEKLLKHVSIVSVISGNRDKMVFSELADLSTMLPREHALSAFTTAIPDVWMSMEHEVIVWCNQMVRLLTRALLDITDATSSSQTRPLKDRMRIFRRLFLGEVEHAHESMIDFTLKQVRHEWIQLPTRRQHFMTDLVLLDLGSVSTNDTSVQLQIITSLPSPQFLLCDNRQDRLRCVDRPDLIRRLPSMQFDPQALQQLTLFEASSAELRTFSVLALRSLASGADGFVLVQQTRADLHVKRINKKLGWLDLAFGWTVPLPRDTLKSTVRFPHLGHAHMMYHVRVRSLSCPATTVSPLMPLIVTQTSKQMGEVKYWSGFGENILINFHAHLPSELDSDGSDSDKNGLQFEFWSDARCSPSDVTISLDFYGVFGRLIRRYHSATWVFPVIIMTCIWARNMRLWITEAKFHSFTKSLGMHLTHDYPRVVLVSLLFYGVAESILGLGVTTMMKQWFGPLDYLELENAWFSLPILWLLGVGFTTIFHLVVSSIVMALSLLTRFYHSFIYRPPNVSRRSQTDPSKLRRQIIGIAALLLSIQTVLPYQFGFVVAYTVLLANITSTMSARQFGGKSAPSETLQHFQYLMVLILFMFVPLEVFPLFVWIKNLSVNWKEGVDNNILAVLPVLIFCVFASDQLPPRPAPGNSNTRLYLWFTLLAQYSFVLFSLISGIGHIYRLYDAIQLLLCLMLAYYTLVPGTRLFIRRLTSSRLKHLD